MAYKRFLLSAASGLTFTVETSLGPAVCTLNVGQDNYFVLGDGSANDLLLQFKSQLDAENLDSGVFTVTLTTAPSATAAPLITVACTVDFDIYTDSGDTFDIAELGLTTKGGGSISAADMVSSGHIPLIWHPSVETREFEPKPKRKGSQLRTVSNAVWNYARTTVAEDRMIGWEMMSRARTLKTEGGDESLQAFWERSGTGRRFRVYEDSTLNGTYQFANHESFDVQRFSPGFPGYRIDMELLEDAE